jgi:hypothetical protein
LSFGCSPQARTGAPLGLRPAGEISEQFGSALKSSQSNSDTPSGKQSSSVAAKERGFNLLAQNFEEPAAHAGLSNWQRSRLVSLLIPPVFLWSTDRPNA